MWKLKNRYTLRNYFERFAYIRHSAFILCVFGFCIGIFFLFFIDDPYKLHWPDSKTYFRAAKEVFETGTFSDRRISPGFPYFWGLLMYITGDSILLAKFFFVSMVIWLMYSIYLLGKAAFNKEVGVLFLLLSLGYPYFFYIPATLCSESLTIIIMPSLFLLMVVIGNNFNWKLLIFISFHAAFIVLLRPTNVIVLIVIPFYWFLIKKWSFTEWIVRSFILAIIPTIVVFGWMLRNYHVDNDFFFSRGGESVLLQTYNTNSLYGVKRYAYPEEIQQRLAKASGFNENARIMKEEAFLFIKNNKFKSLQIALMNCLNYWNPFPPTYSSEGMADVRYKRLVAIPYTLFLVIGLLGLFKNRHYPLFKAFVLLMVLNTFFNAPLMLSVRYRVIIDFSFILMAAFYLYTRLGYEKCKNATIDFNFEADKRHS